MMSTHVSAHSTTTTNKRTKSESKTRKSPSSSSTSLVALSNNNIDKNNNISIHAHSHKNPRQVLSEDTYISTLSSIISRDYFPALPALRRDTAILEARSVGDTAKAVAIRRAARTLELAEQLELDDAQTLDGKTDLKHLNVDNFHRLATSEDNEEFERTQKKEVLEHRSFVNDVFSSASSSHLRIENKIEDEDHNGKGDDALKLLASDEFNPTPKRLFSDKSKGESQGISKSSLFFTPLHIKAGNDSNVKGQNPTNQIDGSVDKALLDYDHHLMPPPTSLPASITKSRNVSSAQTSSSKETPNATSQNQIYNRYDAKDQDTEKRIQPSETRFPYQSTSRLPSNSTNHNETIRNQKFHVETDTEEEYYSSTNTTDLDASPLSLFEERLARQSYIQKVQKERQTFVNLTPVIIPGTRIPGNPAGIRIGENEEEEPIMTWGDVASTPLVVGLNESNLSSRDRQSNEKINEWTSSTILPPEQVDVREQVGQMLDKQNMKKKEQKNRISSKRKKSKSSGSILDRTANLTPAAQSLLRSKVGASPALGILGKNVIDNENHKRKRKGSSSIMSSINARNSGALGSALRQSYSTPRSTPSRSSSIRRRKSGSSTVPQNMFASTPRIQSRHKRDYALKNQKHEKLHDNKNTEKNRLRTDNLLDLENM